jgi:hypothetical protein
MWGLCGEAVKLRRDDREALGKVVRRVWVRFKQREMMEGKPTPDHHLSPWEELSESDKEVDRQIGEAVFFGAATFLGMEPPYNTTCAKCKSPLSDHDPDGVCPGLAAY